MDVANRPGIAEGVIDTRLTKFKNCTVRLNLNTARPAQVTSSIEINLNFNLSAPPFFNPCELKR